MSQESIGDYVTPHGVMESLTQTLQSCGDSRVKTNNIESGSRKSAAVFRRKKKRCFWGFFRAEISETSGGKKCLV